MPAKSQRLTALVDKPIYDWLKGNARKRGISISLVMRDILNEAYEREEDLILAQEGEERLKTFKRSEALTLEEAFGEHK